MPKVSIIVPCYNLGQYLDEAIDSVLAQTFQDFEIIIVNDGSTDESTNSLLSNYNKPKTRVLTTENQGLPSARNNGIKISTGEYICCLDSDDMLRPEYLEATVNVLDHDLEGKHGFVATWVQLFGEENSVWENIDYNPFRLAAENGIHVASLFRKKCWEEVGGYATNLSGYQDWDFWMSIVAKGYGWETICRPLSCYRKRHDSMLKTSDSKSIELYGQIINNHLEFYAANYYKILLESRSVRENLYHYYKGALEDSHDKEQHIQMLNVEIESRELKIAYQGQQLVEKEQRLVQQAQQLANQDQQLAEQQRQMEDLEQQLLDEIQLVAERNIQLAELNRQVAERDRQLNAGQQRIAGLLNSLSWKITAPLRAIGNLVSDRGEVTRNIAESLVLSKDKVTVFKPYEIRIQRPISENRPRVVHVLGNFMTGGSSQLVVDIIERMGHLYEQEVIVCYKPPVPAYLGVPVREFRKLPTPEKIIQYLQTYRPDMMHVHYWGSTDTNWYGQIFKAAAIYGCKVIENINTPVTPYICEQIDRYVYVSDYVYKTFGENNDISSIIYPGSNFELFKQKHNNMPDNCIGMVYRLENDKLNERSIDAFIKAAKRRPGTKAIIVGGGSLLEPYKAAVKAADLEDSFLFTGYVAYERLPELYEQMSIFVAPVWQESFGQVTPFAMNMGIAVAGYDIGALSEILGTNEQLASPGDSDRLAEIIVELLEDREKRLAIGATNQARAQQHFSVEAMISSYEELYQTLLGAGK